MSASRPSIKCGTAAPYTTLEHISPELYSCVRTHILDQYKFDDRASVSQHIHVHVEERSAWWTRNDNKKEFVSVIRLEDFMTRWYAWCDQQQQGMHAYRDALTHDILRGILLFYLEEGQALVGCVPERGVSKDRVWVVQNGIRRKLRGTPIRGLRLIEEEAPQQEQQIDQNEEVDRYID
eukprot:TRINITY_DN8380_c0_g1_i1.p1 TRINITY_DN8380_c0_g1~~TRINITY_DN8380_c0_g1_i1.p1  ORF type:complete len:179 (-),score=50.96 TRINITY_DN8380_c0_g1_i1:19-555(-)